MYEDHLGSTEANGKSADEATDRLIEVENTKGSFVGTEGYTEGINKRCTEPTARQGC